MIKHFKNYSIILQSEEKSKMLLNKKEADQLIAIIEDALGKKTK